MPSVFDTSMNGQLTSTDDTHKPDWKAEFDVLKGELDHGGFVALTPTHYSPANDTVNGHLGSVDLELQSHFPVADASDYTVTAFQVGVDGRTHKEARTFAAVGPTLIHFPAGLPSTASGAFEILDGQTAVLSGDPGVVANGVDLDAGTITLQAGVTTWWRRAATDEYVVKGLVDGEATDQYGDLDMHGNDLLNAGNLAAVATSGDYGDLLNLPTLGTAADNAEEDFATAAQGALADTALQPADPVTSLDFSATARLAGRNAAGAGATEELTAATVRSMLNVEDGAAADQTGDEIAALSRDWGSLGAQTLDAAIAEAASLPAGSLDELTDVTITTVGDGEVLQWDGGTSQWINQTLAEANIATADHDHAGVYEPVDATILRQADVDDAPVNGATTVPVSSNWAFDHAALTNAHLNWAVDQGVTDIHAENIPDLSAVYATAAQGALADTALQPDDIYTISSGTSAAAISTALQAGGVVVFEPGTYDLGTLSAGTVLANDLEMRGLETGRVWLSMPGLNHAQSTGLFSLQMARFRCSKIGFLDGVSPFDLDSLATGIDLEITDCEGVNLGALVRADSVLTYSASAAILNLVVARCRLRDCANGVYLRLGRGAADTGVASIPVTRAVVEGNDFEGLDKYGIVINYDSPLVPYPVDGVAIARNNRIVDQEGGQFSDGSTFTGFGINLSAAKRAVISGNYLKDIRQGTRVDLEPIYGKDTSLQITGNTIVGGGSNQTMIGIKNGDDSQDIDGSLVAHNLLIGDGDFGDPLELGAEQGTLNGIWIQGNRVVVRDNIFRGQFRNSAIRDSGATAWSDVSVLNNRFVLDDVGGGRRAIFFQHPGDRLRIAGNEAVVLGGASGSAELIRIATGATTCSDLEIDDNRLVKVAGAVTVRGIFIDVDVGETLSRPKIRRNLLLGLDVGIELPDQAPTGAVLAENEAWNCTSVVTNTAGATFTVTTANLGFGAPYDTATGAIDWTVDQGATDIHAENIPDLSAVYATAAQGTLADSALQPGDLASGAITARADDLDFSGGSSGHVWTVQADGSAAFQAPTGGGDMSAATYDPQAIGADAFARANHTGTQAAGTITGLATVATSGAYGDLSGLPTLGTAADNAEGDFATAAQGALADSAVQPADLVSGDANNTISAGFEVWVGTTANLPGTPDANTLYFTTD